MSQLTGPEQLKASINLNSLIFSNYIQTDKTDTLDGMTLLN